MRNERGLRATKRRAERQAAQKRELRQAVHDAGIDLEVLADSAGVDASYISRKASDACKDSVSMLELAAWLLDDECRPVAERLLRSLLVPAGYDIVEKRAIASDGDAYRFLDEDLARSSALHRELVQATSEQSEEGRDYSHGELLAIHACLLERNRVSAQLLGAIEQRLAKMTDGTTVVPLPSRKAGA